MDTPAREDRQDTGLSTSADYYRGQCPPEAGVPTWVIASHAPGSTPAKPVTIWLDVTPPGKPEGDPGTCVEMHLPVRYALRVAVALVSAAVRSKMGRQEADVIAVARP